MYVYTHILNPEMLGARNLEIYIFATDRHIYNEFPQKPKICEPSTIFVWLLELEIE